MLLAAPELATQQDRVTDWLKMAIRRGSVGGIWEGNFPRYVWFMTEGTVFEGRLVNRAAGWYKGYPLTKEEWPQASPKRMSDFSITAEWLEADEVLGTELASTWCSLAIRADGESVTRAFSRRSRTVRDSVFISAYPLAEWIATSWWQLFEERENPERLGKRSFRETHQLVYARDGYALPSLHIACLGETSKLDWRAECLGSYGVEFLSSGTTHVRTETLRFAFSEFLNQVVSRLEDCGVQDTLLQEEWAALNALDAEERQFCQALAAVGLDPFAASQEMADMVMEAHKLLSSDLAEELSAVVEGASILWVASHVSHLINELQGSESKFKSVRRIKDAILSRKTTAEYLNYPAWRIGYADARALRAELGLNGEPIGSTEQLVRHLGESDEVLTDLTTDLHLSMVNGILAIDENGSLAVRLATSRPESTLFHFVRAIGTYLYQRSPATALTKAVSDQQSRSRAFAAEFLVPSYVLREEVVEQVVDEERVEDIASKFGVSAYVVHHQLQNHRIAETALSVEDSMPDA